MRSHQMARAITVFVLVAVLMVAAMPFSLHAAPPNTTISGKILDTDGVTPVRDVVIKLKNLTTNTVYESKAADAQGKYKISNVPDGEYSIMVVTSEGEFELPNRLTIMGGQPSIITVILTTAASAAASSGGTLTGGGIHSAAVLIPVIGSVLVAAFTMKEYFEKDGDGSPKLP